MTRFSSILLSCLMLLFHVSASVAQCSDAGVCSLGGAEQPQHLLIFSGAMSYGQSSDEKLRYTDVHLGLQAQVSDDLSLSASIPYRSMTGPLGSTSGMGDLLIAGRYIVWSSGEIDASVEGGLRVASGPVNEKGLPQAYQPGLGTTDALIGISAAGPDWSAAVGYQHAPGRSANRINQLRRGDDLSLRATYTFTREVANITGEVIMVHKLQESDGYYLRTASGAFQFAPGGSGIPNTDRTQINLVGDVSYPLESGMILNVRGAMALLSRPVNVDGLKRNFTLQAGISLPLL